jgi:GLPGLI family protein
MKQRLFLLIFSVGVIVLTNNYCLAQTTEIIYLDVLADPSKDGGGSHAYRSKLLTNGRQSAFYHKSIDTTFFDSSGEMKDFPEGSKFHLRYLKDITNSKVSYRTRTGSSIGSIIDKVFFEYKFGKETKKILGYDCKQVFLEWRGRYLEIYYAPDIAIQDGPFKFMGLPGLILSVKDPQKAVFLEAKSIRMKSDAAIPTSLENYKNPISYTEYVKKFTKFREALISKLQAEDPGTTVSLPYKEIEIIHPDYIN